MLLKMEVMCILIALLAMPTSASTQQLEVAGKPISTGSNKDGSRKIACYYVIVGFARINELFDLEISVKDFRNLFTPFEKGKPRLPGVYV